MSWIYVGTMYLGLVWFYGISTIVGYLMLNPLYTYTPMDKNIRPLSKMKKNIVFTIFNNQIYER